MANAFMTASAKAKRGQEDIEKKKKGEDEEEYVVTNVRLPKELHRKVLLHRVETGENMTQLIRRLLLDELG